MCNRAAKRDGTRAAQNEARHDRHHIKFNCLHDEPDGTLLRLKPNVCVGCVPCTPQHMGGILPRAVPVSFLGHAIPHARRIKLDRANGYEPCCFENQAARGRFRSLLPFT
jgi:hypothetical protein